MGKETFLKGEIMKAKNVVLVTLFVATLIAVSGIVVYAVQAEQNTKKQVEAIIEEIGGTKKTDKELEAKLEAVADEVLANIDFSSLFVEEDFQNINFEKSFAALDAVGLKPEWVSRPYCLSGLSGKKILVAIDIERAARVEPYGLTAKAIFRQTQKQLQDYGIKVISQKELQAIPDYQRLVLGLYVNINAQLIEGIDIVPINTSIRFVEAVQLARSPEKFCVATTWQEETIQMGVKEALPQVATTVRDVVQVFINDYLAANPQAADDSQLIKGTGTIRYAEVEGGFYEIHADNGESYDPINLPSSYAKDGIRVKFTVRYRPDMVSIHMSGKIVEILKIEKLEKPKQKQ